MSPFINSRIARKAKSINSDPTHGGLTAVSEVTPSCVQMLEGVLLPYFLLERQYKIFFPPDRSLKQLIDYWYNVVILLLTGHLQWNKWACNWSMQNVYGIVESI